METNPNFSRKLEVLHQGRSVIFDAPLEVLYFYRVSHLIFLVTLDGNEYRIKKTLSSLEEQFENLNFMQINRSVIINLNFVVDYEEGQKRDTLALVFKHTINNIISKTEKERLIVTKEHISAIKKWANNRNIE
ncbi:LytTR family transcriptional regulator DNA-binding domain-containing protein [Pedobacter sp. KLB.chiD]|uniref:LytTR family transcriptional regulator DNA-binding domain-containing protein n=1 Tax=Pedobacter sp. KLB.chiD TaxID=3387402 RepID=UPI00399A2553